MLTTVPGIRQ